MKKLTFTLFAVLTLCVTTAYSQIIITGVIDGPLTGGVPKAVELYVTANIADLSVYGVGVANNGGGTDGQEFTFPAVSAAAGDFIYVASESVQFNAFFGFNPDHTNSKIDMNGDDAVELFKNGVVMDVLGDVAISGTGTAWEFLDGWAYRKNGTTANGTFQLNDWTFSGINALDNMTTNATALIPFPTASYKASSFSGTVHQVDVGGTGLSFTPPNLTINVGDSVVWTNKGGHHNVDGSTATYPNNPEGFTSGAVSMAAWVYGKKFTIAGFYDYECNPHAGAGMVGTVTVLSDSSIEATDDAATLNQNSSAVLNILANDKLPNGIASLDVFAAPAHGTATANGVANITYTPMMGFCGADSFQYVICDAKGLCDTASVSLTVVCLPTYFYTAVAPLKGVNAAGVADSLAKLFEVRGVVYGVDLRGGAGYSFTLIDPTNGINVFRFSDLTNYTTPNEGDSIHVFGKIEQFNGLIEIVPDSIALISQANNINSPVVVTKLDESTESNLVMLENLTIVDPAEWTNAGSGFNVRFTNGADTFVIRIDNDVNLYGITFPSNAVVAFSGIGGQYDATSPYTSGYQLFPRYQADLTGAENTNKAFEFASKVRVFPNPTTEFLQVNTLVPVSKIVLTDAKGQTLETKNNVFGTVLFDVRHFSTGIYFATFQTKNGNYTVQFVVE